MTMQEGMEIFCHNWFATDSNDMVQASMSKFMLATSARSIAASNVKLRDILFADLGYAPGPNQLPPWSGAPYVPDALTVLWDKNKRDDTGHNLSGVFRHVSIRVCSIFNIALTLLIRYDFKKLPPPDDLSKLYIFSKINASDTTPPNSQQYTDWLGAQMLEVLKWEKSRVMLAKKAHEWRGMAVHVSDLYLNPEDSAKRQGGWTTEHHEGAFNKSYQSKYPPVAACKALAGFAGTTPYKVLRTEFPVPEGIKDLFLKPLKAQVVKMLASKKEGKWATENSMQQKSMSNTLQTLSKVLAQDLPLYMALWKKEKESLSNAATSSSSTSSSPKKPPAFFDAPMFHTDLWKQHEKLCLEFNGMPLKYAYCYSSSPQIPFPPAVSPLSEHQTPELPAGLPECDSMLFSGAGVVPSSSTSQSDVYPSKVAPPQDLIPKFASLPLLVPDFQGPQGYFQGVVVFFLGSSNRRGWVDRLSDFSGSPKNLEVALQDGGVAASMARNYEQSSKETLSKLVSRFSTSPTLLLMLVFDAQRLVSKGSGSNC